MLTIGIPTYNRKKILEVMASSLYESDISIPHNIRIYDDCSTEYGIEKLKEIFPTATSIKINDVNLKADKNTYQMYHDFLSTSDELFFNADSDLIFKKDWIKTALKLFEKTNGILSVFNANSHESYKIIDDELCLKKTIGAAGTLFHRDRLSEFLANIASPDTLTEIDWQFSKYFNSIELPIYCVKNSLVQHIGYFGQNSKYFFDFGRNFKVETSNQGQIINDIFEKFIDTIRNLEKEKDINDQVINKQNNSFFYHLRRCMFLLIKTILPKKIFNFLKAKKNKNKTTKNINILFDATVFARSYIKGSSNRSGIYFVAYNILKYIADDPYFVINFYVNDNFNNVKYFKKDSLLSQFPVYLNLKENKLFNIEVHKNNIKTTNNIIKKFLYSLKIIKNHINLFFCHNNNSLLKRIDIFFSPLYPANKEVKNYPSIIHFIILHDLIPVLFDKDFFTLDNHWFNSIIKSLDKETHYFCNSNYTRNDFLKYYGDKLDENKMIVTYISSSQNFYPDHDKTKLVAALNKYKIKYKNNNNYIFSLCNLDPRKNLIFTVKCFIKFISKHNIEDLYFYIGGSKWNEFIYQLEKEIDNFNKYRDKIAGLGYVNDIDVNVLYSNSLFFTFISKYEGFGVPVLEAMQAGTPVISSNSSSLPEVVGDAAIVIEPDSEDQCIKAFENLYFNEDLRKSYIEKGFERAKLFSWEKTVEIMRDYIISSLQKNDKKI